MRTDDSDTENIENAEINTILSKQFSKFIRLKGIEKFCHAMRSNNCASSHCKQHKLRSCKDANNNEMSDQESDMDQDTSSSSRSNCDAAEMARMDETEGSGDEIDARIRTEYGSPFEWFKVWREISASLDSIKFNNENHLCVENYTLLLRIHVMHRFTLDMNCYRSLLHCIRPELVEKIFDMSLIDKEDAFHIGCLIESDDLFTGIDALANNIDTINKYAPNILYSLSVLIYRDKECLNHASKIISSMNSELAVFINREDHLHSPVYNNLKQAVRQFLLACTLNGIFSDHKKLDSFLTNRETESTDDSLSDSSISDLISDSDSDSSSPNEALERIIQDVHRIRRIDQNQLRVDLPYNPRSPPPPNNNGNNNNNNNLNIKSVADRMNINASEFKKLLYPMSLKNLCRVAIKISMDPYDLNSVNKLTILPNVLKRFMLFQDEIDGIIKLAQNE